MIPGFVLQHLEQSLQVTLPEGAGESADILLLCSGEFLYQVRSHFKIDINCSTGCHSDPLLPGRDQGDAEV